MCKKLDNEKLFDMSNMSYQKASKKAEEFYKKVGNKSNYKEIEINKENIDDITNKLGK